jgi:uncharacterized RDD family membrane protein YckC
VAVGQEEALDNTTWVETPEQVRFRYHVAGPTRRYLAYLIDFVIRALVFLLVSFIIGVATGVGMGAGGLGTGLLLVLIFGMEWGYYVLFETLWNGRTPGKRALGLRVVKEGGYPLSFMDSVLRTLLRAADGLPPALGVLPTYASGVLTAAFDKRFRRLGDRVASTMVVIEEPVRVATAIVIDPAPTRAELDLLPARPPLSADEFEALDLFFRRNTLSEARRHELAALVAPTFARRMGTTASDSLRFLEVLYFRVREQTVRKRDDAANRTGVAP